MRATVWLPAWFPWKQRGDHQKQNKAFQADYPSPPVQPPVPHSERWHIPSPGNQHFVWFVFSLEAEKRQRNSIIGAVGWSACRERQTP